MSGKEAFARAVATVAICGAVGFVAATVTPFALWGLLVIMIVW